MTPVIVPKIKEKLFLVSPNNFWDPRIPNFILNWQINRSIHIQLWWRGRLTAMTRYKSCTNIIWKPNKALWRLRILLPQLPNSQTKQRLSDIGKSRGSEGPNTKETNLVWKNEKPRSFIDLYQNISECGPPFISWSSSRDNDSTTVSTNRSFRYLCKMLFRTIIF